MISPNLLAKLPKRVRDTVDRWLEMADIFRELKDPRVARSLGPAGVRGLVLRRGKQEIGRASCRERV